MARARSEQHGLAVCFLDLDGFKAVNDTHGHEAGDELLVIVAQRLLAHIRTGDTAARLGGDEFVVLLCDLRDLHECEQVAQRLLRAICEPMVVEGHTVQVGASMGIALYPQHGSQAEQLLRQSLPRLQDTALQASCWRALAILAEQRNDPAAATTAWRAAALARD